MLVIPVLRTEKQMGTWNALANKLAYLVSFRPVKKQSQKIRWIGVRIQTWLRCLPHIQQGGAVLAARFSLCLSVLTCLAYPLP